MDNQQRFFEKITELDNKSGKNSRSLSSEEYQQIIARLLEIENARKENRRGILTVKDCNLMRSYEVAVLREQEYHYLKKRGTDLRVVPVNEIYDILKSAHMDTGHGGRDTMRKRISTRFHNITIAHISVFISLCEECQLKRSRVQKSIVVRPILSKEMNSRCQVCKCCWFFISFLITSLISLPIWIQIGNSCYDHVKFFPIFFLV